MRRSAPGMDGHLRPGPGRLVYRATTRREWSVGQACSVIGCHGCRDDVPAWPGRRPDPPGRRPGRRSHLAAPGTPLPPRARPTRCGEPRGHLEGQATHAAGFRDLGSVRAAEVHLPVERGQRGEAVGPPVRVRVGRDPRHAVAAPDTAPARLPLKGPRGGAPPAARPCGTWSAGPTAVPLRPGGAAARPRPGRVGRGRPGAGRRREDPVRRRRHAPGKSDAPWPSTRRARPAGAAARRALARIRRSYVCPIVP